MKVLYLQTNMGAAGDMLMSALLELIDDQSSFINQMNDLNIAGAKVVLKEDFKQGIKGSHIQVLINNEEEGESHNIHTHQHLSSIKERIDQLKVSEKIKKDVYEVYQIIAKAESEVHDCPVNEIHFHEVGDKDALVDISGVCLLMDLIKPDRVICSPINVGSGSVKCAHGILPVPAPATAKILQNNPTYSNEVIGELCTPTGAALIKYFTNEYNTQPIMKVEKIGNGLGSKDFKYANILRASLGTTNEKSNNEVVELVCNIDDMSGEELSFAFDELFKAGALDVYTSPIQMKKNRMGFKLSCLCETRIKGRIIQTIFKHTSTIGIREYNVNRYTLNRTKELVDSNLGEVTVKRSEGFSVFKEKIEHDDLAKIAKENHVSISEVKAKIKLKK